MNRLSSIEGIRIHGMDEDFNNECIKAHNELRSLHRTPNLKMSRKLAQESQEWASFISAKSLFKHSNTNGVYGENLAISSSKQSGEETTLGWYSEFFEYKFGQERQEVAKIGHFTQVVWADSIEAGFGRAVSSEGYWYVVGRYVKAGNIIGKFMKNVNQFISGWESHPMIRKIKVERSPRSQGSLLNELWRRFDTVGEDVVKLDKNDGVNENKYPSSDSKNYSADNYNNGKDIVCPINVRANFTSPPINGVKSRGKNESNSEDDDLSEFREEVLRNHNEIRKNHGVRKLTLNSALCQMAQKWADSLMETHQLRNSCERYMDNEVGENIAVVMDGDLFSGNRLLTGWYKEEHSFEYGSEPTNFEKIGHFSQLVWAASQELGIGLTKTDSNNLFVVCFYFPAGNIKGEFSQNVYPTVDL